MFLVKDVFSLIPVPLIQCHFDVKRSNDIENLAIHDDFIILCKHIIQLIIRNSKITNFVINVLSRNIINSSIVIPICVVKTFVFDFRKIHLINC